MNLVLFSSILTLFITAYVSVSFFFARSIKKTESFSAEHSFGVLPITLTLIATQLGGGMLLGTAQEAYTSGLYGMLYALSIILGFLILGCGVAGKIQSARVTTTAQLFESVYNAPHLKQVASLLSIITLSGLFISQIVGSRSLLCSLQITSPLIFASFWLLIIISTIIGGLKGIIWANFVQITYIFFLFTGIFIYCLTQESFALSLFSFESLQSMHSTDTTYAMLARTLIMPALYCLIEQGVAQRFFAARTKRIAVHAAIYASILFFFFALIPMYFGIKARILNIPLQASASPLLPSIAYLTNEIFAALAACGVLTAIISTANSLLCAISSNITQDFLFNSSASYMKNRGAKSIPLLAGISCLIISFYIPSSLINIIIDSYSISIVCLLVPLLFAYYNRSLPTQAATYAISAGAAAYGICYLYPLYLPKEFIGLLCSFVGFIIGRYRS